MLEIVREHLFSSIIQENMQSKNSRRTSPTVQWLRICLSMQGIWVRSLVGKLRFPHALEQVSPSATTIAGIKIAGRNTNNLRYADDTTLMAESEGELKRLLMKVREESEKVGLKLNIQKTKIMASGPITSGQTDGETVETVADFIFLGSKITADGDCSHEIKRRLILGRKVMTNLDTQRVRHNWATSLSLFRQHIKKQRHYFASKGPTS